MKTWNEMTYDEQRALLGLPNVKYAVIGTRCAIAARNMMAALHRLGNAFQTVGQESDRQSDYALAGPKGAK